LAVGVIHQLFQSPSFRLQLSIQEEEGYDVMSIKPRGHNTTELIPAVICIGLFIQFIVLGPVSGAADVLPKILAGGIKTELEGIQFVGPFGAEKEVRPKEDTFTFKDGKFATGSCLEWGFVPAPYWVRRDEKGIHFLAELKSPEHGTMRYEGVFDGKELKVVGYWKKQRWYWTTERTYRGKGRPSTQIK
jgi:hypothetical protein